MLETSTCTPLEYPVIFNRKALPELTLSVVSLTVLNPYFLDIIFEKNNKFIMQDVFVQCLQMLASFEGKINIFLNIY